MDTTDEALARLGTQAGRFGPDRLTRILDLLGELGTEIRWSSDSRLSLEVALTRMARPDGELTLDALAERVEALEMGSPVSAAQPPLPAPPADTPPPPVSTSDAEDAEPASDAAEDTPDAQSHGAPAAEPDPHPIPEVDASSVGEETVVEVEHLDSLDRAHVKRAWPAVLAEVKRVKASRSHIFTNTEVDVDADGATLVIEFPSDQNFTLDLAKSPDTRLLLQQALIKVLGGKPAFRYQLGRGQIRPVAVPEPVPPTDVAPATGGDETDNAPGPVGVEQADEDEIERMLHSLGAEKVAEVPHEADDGKGEHTK